jgi:hypothetical protein
MADDSAPQNDHNKDAPQAPEMALFYANASGVRGGAFDVSIEFAYAIPPTEGEAPKAPLWLARVAMSWEHAQALRDLLDGTLKQYQEAVGELPDIERLKAGEK